MATERREMKTETKALQYYVFKETDSKRYLEGRFWNQGGKQLAIVAIITEFNGRGDWAAYIGTDAPDSHSEEKTLLHVAEHGCKLMQGDAKHFFPDIPLPYRY